MRETCILHASSTLFLLVLVATVTAQWPPPARQERTICEEEVTARMKFKLVRDSLETVKTLFPRCRDPDEDPNKCSKRDTALAHMNLALDTLVGLKAGTGGREIEGFPSTKPPVVQVLPPPPPIQLQKECPKCPPVSEFIPVVSGGNNPVDCSDIMYMDERLKKSGVYTIYPRNRVNGTRAITVYCDMDTDGGGWTVIQRRGNYTTQTDFHQKWEAYKNGFGDVEKDFWLGNENIYTLSNQGVYSLRIDMKNNNKEYRFSLHDNFWIDNEESGYVLHLAEFKGNSSNDLNSQIKKKFSTKDRQNDGNQPHQACADHFHGAWWYPPGGGCGQANPNGLYMPGIDNKNSNWWWHWTGYKGLFFIEMKIRHRNPK